MICLTDHDRVALDDVEMIQIGSRLPGWWSKMRLFDPDVRGPGRCIYFDLDTLLLAPFDSLLDIDAEFGNCANFARLAGAPMYRDHLYGSCVMTFAEGWGRDIWERFSNSADEMMERHRAGGDQKAIEELWPNALLLQAQLPDRFFAGHPRPLKDRPEDTAVLIFGGGNKPHRAAQPWIQEEWRRAKRMP